MTRYALECVQRVNAGLIPGAGLGRGVVAFCLSTIAAAFGPTRQKGRIDSVGLDELFRAWDSVGSRLSLFRELPDGGRSPATKLELAVAYAINIARDLKWQRIYCVTLGGNHGVPWGLGKVLEKLPNLHRGLIDLGGVLSDTSVRQQLASANTDAVEFAGEFAPSYAEAVFTVGERLLVTMTMLCLHGVEYNYLSRLHPAAKPEDLGEPWKSVPVPSDVVFRPNHAGCLRSQEMLVSRIVNFILDSPEVNDDHVRILLEKEIGRVAMGEPSSKATKRKAKRSSTKDDMNTKSLIIAALNEHHQYSNGKCEDVGHVGVNKLAKYLKISPSTVSGFFKTEFGGHDKYRIACGNLGNLANALKILNGELTPCILFNRLGDNDSNLADE